MATISAIVRTFNSAPTLAACLRSLRMQTQPLIEIIVVDSGSTDQTLAIAAKYGARITHYPSRERFNYARALNLGIASASGEWLLSFSSHNVMLLNTCLETMLRLAEQTSAIGAYSVTSRTPAVTRAEPTSEHISIANFDGFNGLWNTCSLIRRSGWQTLPFDESMPTAEDQAWAAAHLRVPDAHTVRIEPGNVLCRNPRPLFWKHVREQIVITTRVLSEHRRQSFWQRLLNGARQLRQGHGRQAMSTWCVACGLLLQRLPSRHV